MELSKTVSESISTITSSNFSSDEIKQIILYCFQSVRHNEKKTPPINSANFKQAIYGLTLLIFECIRLSSDDTTVTTLLESFTFSKDHCDLFLNLLKENRPFIKNNLKLIGHQPPHIVDIDWRQDYTIKSNNLEKLDSLNYLIKLKTETPDGEKDIQFSCTLEQLQDLVFKLKDATKCLERIAQKNA